MNRRKAPIHHTIMFKVALGLLFFDGLLLGGITMLMNTVGQDLVLEESSRVTEGTGNTIVETLTTRLKSVESLARSIANIGESLPLDPSMLKKVVKKVIDHDGDTAIAGGGLWYEPKAFDGKTLRKSFFWGRGEDQSLTFFNDYNTPGLEYSEKKFDSDPRYQKDFLKSPGYHNEEWYVVVRHIQEKDASFWSRSYVDPYSGEPMVTVTVPLRSPKGDFLGVSTIDLKLDGLSDLLRQNEEKTGGYIFLSDRNGKFISFSRKGIGIKQDKKQGYMTIEEFVNQTPKFQTIANGLSPSKMNQSLPSSTGHLAQMIDKASYQIGSKEALVIENMIRSKFIREHSETNLTTRTPIEDDFLLNEKSMVSFFNVPGTNWNLVIVKPYRAYVAVAEDIRDTLIKIFGVIVLCTFLIALSYQIIFVVKPIKRITSNIEIIGNEIQMGKSVTEIDPTLTQMRDKGELGKLFRVFNLMTKELQNAERRLQVHNERLEELVDERTKELKDKSDKITLILEQREENLSIIEQKNAEYKSLVRVLCHDISNPLSIIAGSSILGSSKKDLKFYDKIRKAADRIEDMISKIRDQEALATGKKRLKLVPTDMQEVCEDVAFLFQDKADAKGLELSFENNLGHRKVQADPTSITNEVLSNLVSNAVKFCNKGGKIKVAMDHHDQECVIKVSDNGIGIPPDILPKIFDNNSSVSRKGTGGEPGTGFGMPLVKEYTELHGGTIEVESDASPESHGTTFTVTLKMAA